jgi:hypothetical protein
LKTGTRRAARTLARIEGELPPTLGQFERRVRRGLEGLERRIERAEARTRRQLARLLREASHTLGRYEAAGEARWRKLTSQARRDALRVLRNLEAQLEPAGARQAASRAKSPRRRRRAA